MGDISPLDLLDRLWPDHRLEDREIVAVGLDRIVRMAGLLQVAPVPVAGDIEAGIGVEIGHDPDRALNPSRLPEFEQRRLEDTLSRVVRVGWLRVGLPVNWHGTPPATYRTGTSRRLVNTARNVKYETSDTSASCSSAPCCGV